jgi:hypothetical protein
MLSRIDGVNNFMYSDSVTQWDNPFSYRNLVIHGNLLKLETGPNLDCRMVSNYTWCRAMRRYCIGASLDLDDPSKEIGRLKEPLLSHEKMNGRICTQWFILRCNYSQQQLNLPYAVSDYSSTYAVVDLAELISEKKSITAAEKKAWGIL